MESSGHRLRRVGVPLGAPFAREVVASEWTSLREGPLHVRKCPLGLGIARNASPRRSPPYTGRWAWERMHPRGPPPTRHAHRQAVECPLPPGRCTGRRPLGPYVHPFRGRGATQVVRGSGVCGGAGPFRWRCVRTCIARWGASCPRVRAGLSQDRTVLSPLMACIQVKHWNAAHGWLRAMTHPEVAWALPPSHRMAGYSALHLFASKGPFGDDMREFMRLLILKACSPIRGTTVHTYASAFFHHPPLINGARVPNHRRQVGREFGKLRTCGGAPPTSPLWFGCPFPAPPLGFGCTFPVSPLWFGTPPWGAPSPHYVPLWFGRPFPVARFASRFGRLGGRN